MGTGDVETLKGAKEKDEDGPDKRRYDEGERRNRNIEKDEEGETQTVRNNKYFV